jgi:hypothetical protein
MSMALQFVFSATIRSFYPFCGPGTTVPELIRTSSGAPSPHPLAFPRGPSIAARCSSVKLPRRVFILSRISRAGSNRVRRFQQNNLASWRGSLKYGKSQFLRTSMGRRRLRLAASVASAARRAARDHMRLADVLATPVLAERDRRRLAIAGDESFDIPVRQDDKRSPIGLIVADVMAVCDAQSAGVSVFRRSVPDELTWIFAIGRLAEFQGRRFPLRHSICGVCFDYGSTQLFARPHRYFRWMEQAGISISETLVTPLVSVDGSLYGTIWTMCHSGPSRGFDIADALALEERARRVTEAIWPKPRTAG